MSGKLMRYGIFAVLAGALVLGAVTMKTGAKQVSPENNRPDMSEAENAPEPPIQHVRDLLKRREPVTWLFYGDSITMGSRYTQGWRDYTQLFAERVRFELRRKPDFVVNTAISSDNTDRLVAGFDRRVRQFRPDVVFLMIGMNDCTLNDKLRSVPPDRFRANLRALVAMVREMPGSSIVLQTTCPILPGSLPEREAQFDEYMDIIREVAAETGCPLIDHISHWRELIAANPERHAAWMGHGCHPNQYGHRVFAELIFRELGIFDERSPTCALSYP